MQEDLGVRWYVNVTEFVVVRADARDDRHKRIQAQGFLGVGNRKISPINNKIPRKGEREIIDQRKDAFLSLPYLQHIHSVSEVVQRLVRWQGKLFKARWCSQTFYSAVTAKHRADKKEERH